MKFVCKRYKVFKLNAIKRASSESKYADSTQIHTYIHTSCEVNCRCARRAAPHWFTFYAAQLPVIDLFTSNYARALAGFTVTTKLLYIT